MRKICIMHQASIGDTLIATPVYRAVKETYPQCKTVVITSYAGYELLYKNPYIDVLMPYKKGDKIFPIIKAMWRADAALILDYRYRNALYAFLAMIPKRIGYGKDFINVKVNNSDPHEFEVLKYLRLAEQIGAYTDNLTLIKPHISSEEIEHVNKLYNEAKGNNNRLIVIAPYSLAKIKDWKPAKYYEIIERLKSANIVSVILGGKEQTELAAKDFPNAVNLAGKTNLRESAEFIAKADLMICGCTSMLHFCATTDTPSIAIYGPTLPDKWAPRKNCTVITHRLDCSPCYCIEGKTPCQSIRCLNDISIDEVWTAVKNTLHLGE